MFVYITKYTNQPHGFLICSQLAPLNPKKKKKKYQQQQTKTTIHFSFDFIKYAHYPTEKKPQSLFLLRVFILFIAWITEFTINSIKTHRRRRRKKKHEKKCFYVNVGKNYAEKYLLTRTLTMLQFHYYCTFSFFDELLNNQPPLIRIVSRICVCMRKYARECVHVFVRVHMHATANNGSRQHKHTFESGARATFTVRSMNSIRNCDTCMNL